MGSFKTQNVFIIFPAKIRTMFGTPFRAYQSMTKIKFISVRRINM